MKRINSWEPENSEFWISTGRRIAYRNLAISIPCLLLAFAVWMFWSIITVQMSNVGFTFSKDELFTLVAIPGLVGATLRIPNSFLVSISGGRTVIALTTALLLLPAIGVGIAVQDLTTPYWVFVILAVLSGIGGGNFSSSMSNISLFFPKRMQGLALGLNAGIGNLGVSTMQFLVPVVMGFALFGPIGGDPLPLTTVQASGATETWLQNSGFVWVPLLIVFFIAAWIGMTNLKTGELPLPNPFIGVGKALLLIMVIGVGASFIAIGPLLAGASRWVLYALIPVVIAITLILMLVVPGETRVRLKNQFVIFRKKHNWIMTILYIMTFGSFIGYSASFPLFVRFVFGELPDGTPVPGAPDPMVYAWIGPFVGAIARPFGGWLSDKFGGAKVTQWSTIVMIISTFGVAYYASQASTSMTPTDYFLPCFLLFMVLFVTTGIGNGSTFRMIPIIFDSKLAGPVLGWTGAVAAYGAFIIPQVLGPEIKARTPEIALIGFGVFYVICLVLNWWYYARKNAEIKC